MASPERHGFEASVSAKLRKNILYVVSNGGPADAELFGDGRGANAASQQLQDLLLPGRKLRLRLGRASSGWHLRSKAGESARELMDKALHRLLSADIPEDMDEGDAVAGIPRDEVGHVEP